MTNLEENIYTKDHNIHIEELGNINSLSPRDSMASIVYNDQMWLFGGFTPNRSNEILFSSNGTYWEKGHTPFWSKRNLHSVVCFNKKLWLMGGYGGNYYNKCLNDIHSSVDGIKWKLEATFSPWQARAAFGLVEFRENLYLLGGIGGHGLSTCFSDVWKSKDGINWDLVTNDAPWGKRGMMTLAIFKNKIWLLGGGEYDERYVYNIKKNYNDAWSSEDGINWKKETDSTEFSPRRFFRNFVYNNYLHITCGFELDKRIFPESRNGLRKNSLSNQQLDIFDMKKGRDFGNLNDIWRTSDGINWQQIKLMNKFSPRHEPSVIVFKDAVFWIGGFGTVLYNDVWKLKY